MYGEIMRYLWIWEELHLWTLLRKKDINADRFNTYMRSTNSAMNLFIKYKYAHSVYISSCHKILQSIKQIYLFWGWGWARRRLTKTTQVM